MLDIVEIHQHDGTIDQRNQPGKTRTIDQPDAEIGKKETEECKIEEKYHLTV